MVKAVILDLNGIFIVSPKLSERFEKDFGVPVSKFVPKLSEIMEKVRQPNAGSAFKYWEPVLASWNIKFSENEFWKYWFTAEVVSDEMVTLAKELRNKGIKVFILSNNFQERADFYKSYPWIKDAVDKAYFSWESGFVKPDPQAWKVILDEQNLKIEDCIYFDDLEKNVKAAESIGIRAHLFTNVTDLQNILSTV